MTQARTDDTYLENAKIRQLVVTLNGQDQNFDHMDLRCLNLQGANLADASFIGAKLSEATLEGANLDRAKLVQTQLYGANLSGASLTGAIIQDWSISIDTSFDGVKCDYVYMQLPTKADPDPCRKPDNRSEDFQPGDFADFIAPIIKTLNLYQTQNVDLRVVAQQFKTLDLFHHEGIDPAAAAIALKQLAEHYPEADLEVVALEGRGDDKVRLQAKVKGVADRSALSAEYFAAYREMSAMPYADLQSLLAGMAEKDDRIRSLESMVTTAIKSDKFYVETVYSLGDTVTEKSSININAGGDIGNVSGLVGGNVSGVMNLGTISGSVTNFIGQIPDNSAEQAELKTLLQQLQAAIETEPALEPEDKAEALAQVQVLAEAGQKPEDGAMQKAAKTAMKILKGTTTGLSETTKFVAECAKLLPAISGLLLLL
ncbi:MAG: pentapeptide repeat-containing protein [Nodosilinea sp.]